MSKLSVGARILRGPQAEVEKWGGAWEHCSQKEVDQTILGRGILAKSTAFVAIFIKRAGGCLGAPKMLTGSGKGLNLRLLAALNNFYKIGFLSRALLLTEKGATEKRNKNQRETKKMMDIVATNVIAS